MPRLCFLLVGSFFHSLSVEGATQKSS